MTKTISVVWAILLGFVLSDSASWGATVDQFVVFGASRVDIGQGSRAASGDVGSNGRASFARQSQIDGNVFANRIIAGRQSVFRGNVHFNKLQEARRVTILGNRVTPLALPVLDDLPAIADFSTGSTRIVERRGADVTLVLLLIP